LVAEARQKLVLSLTDIPISIGQPETRRNLTGNQFTVILLTESRNSFRVNRDIGKRILIGEHESIHQSDDPRSNYRNFLCFIQQM
jgi:hypothetical protein